MLFVTIALATLAVSALCVWLTGIFATTFGLVAHPRADRWHQRPVALFGGVGIFWAFLSGALFFYSLTGAPPRPLVALAFYLGATLLFGLGLVDDVKRLKPSTKLAGQIVAVSAPIVAGIVFHATPWAAANIILTFCWFIVIINAINILDNMDGLASGVVIIAAATFIVLRIVLEGIANIHDPAFPIAVIFLAAVLGFWFFNRHPASIFMGDAGSLFLGYVLAALIMPSPFNGLLGTSSVLLSLLIPAMIVAVPIFDTILVTINRLWHGRAVSEGGRDHSSHRLVGLGLSEGRAVHLLYGFAALGGIVAVLLARWPASTAGFLALYAVALVLMGIYLGRVKVYPREAEGAPSRWTPLRATLLHKRHLVEVMLDFALIAVSYYFAYLLRYEGHVAAALASFAVSLPIVLASCIFGFFVAGVYRGLWRFIALADIARFAGGVASGVGVSAFLLTLIPRFAGFSPSVLLIFGMLLFTFAVGTRLSFRMLDATLRRRHGGAAEVRVAIYGAGQAGRLLAEECARNELYGQYRVVRFIDDDAEKHRRTLRGIPIVGADDAGGHLAAQVAEVWVSSQKIPVERIRALANVFGQEGRAAVRVRRFSMTVEELPEDTQQSGYDLTGGSIVG